MFNCLLCSDDDLLDVELRSAASNRNHSFTLNTNHRCDVRIQHNCYIFLVIKIIIIVYSFFFPFFFRKYHVI